MKEEDLDRMLAGSKEEDLNPEAEKQFQKKVRRSMNRTIYARAALAILLAAVLAVGLYFGASQTVNLICYRPQRETPFLIPGDSESEEFIVLLEDTVSTYFPGKYCWVLKEPQAHGFGRYSADLLITDAYGPQSYTGPATAQLQIGLSKLNMGHVPLYIQVMEFLDPEYPYSVNPQTEEFSDSVDSVRQELQNLPKSAYMDVSVSFPAGISSEEAARIINGFTGIRVRWLALEGQNVTKFESASGGMFLDHLRGEKMTEEAAEKYPNYYLPHEVTGEALEQCLQSRLQMLIDHPDFVRLMETQFESLISMSMLQERLENAKENWACYGMRLVGGPEEIEKLMDEMSVTYVRINDVKISRFEK